MIFLKIQIYRVIFSLSATKVDLTDDLTNYKPLVRRIEGLDLANRIGAKVFLECSAKTNRGIKEVFEEALCAVISEMSNNNEEKDPCCCC
jgi:GTPase SAR1 family protein